MAALAPTHGGDAGPGELAYEQIRRAIVEGEFVPGQRLVEQKVAEQYDLSRTPVREAIRRLEAEGLVVVERNRGAVVRELSVDDVVDLYELRARLEAYAAELAAARITATELAALHDAVDGFGVAAAATPPAPAIERARSVNDANRHVHAAIVRGAHHDRLAAMLRRTVDIPLVFGAFRSFGPAEMARSDLFHRLIAEAIAAGDGPRAARLMTEHVAQGRDAVLASA